MAFNSQDTIPMEQIVTFGYGVCSDAASVTAKAVSLTDFIVTNGCAFTVQFSNAVNGGDTLNVNGIGAKPIYYLGVAIQSNVIHPGYVVTFQYDGTHLNIISITGEEKPATPSDLYVDMGLPSGLLWARKNIDVTQPDGFAASEFQYLCSFFSWGNIEGHNPVNGSFANVYDWGSNNEGPYASTPGAKLTANAGLSFDGARAVLGAPWRDPSTEEFKELFDNIDYVQADGVTVVSGTDKRVDVNNVKGIYLRSKINGNLLFFPCSGNGNGTSWSSAGSNGYYWSRSLGSQTGGRLLDFGSGGVSPQNTNSRFNGFARRPVQ